MECYKRQAYIITELAEQLQKENKKLNIYDAIEQAKKQLKLK